MSLYLLALAIAPGIAICFYIYFKDRYENVIQCVKPCIGPGSHFESDRKQLEKEQQRLGETADLMKMGRV